MKKKHIAVSATASWLILIGMFMLVAGSMNLEILFVLWLIGVLIIAELIASVYSRTGYYNRLTIFIALGILLFGLIVIRKIQVILSG